MDLFPYSVVLKNCTFGQVYCAERQSFWIICGWASCRWQTHPWPFWLWEHLLSWNLLLNYISKSEKAVEVVGHWEEWKRDWMGLSVRRKHALVLLVTSWRQSSYYSSSSSLFWSCSSASALLLHTRFQAQPACCALIGWQLIALLFLDLVSLN